jgi:hypothetical protein
LRSLDAREKRHGNVQYQNVGLQIGSRIEQGLAITYHPDNIETRPKKVSNNGEHVRVIVRQEYTYSGQCLTL